MDNSIGTVKFDITRLVKYITFLACLSLTAEFYSAAASVTQEKSDEKRKVKVSVAISEAIYKELTKAQELIEVGGTENVNEGLRLLGKLEQQKRLTPYEKAQIYNYFAFTYFQMEDYKKTMNAYLKVLQQPNLPEALIAGTIYTLAQLYFIQEDYRKAIEYINKWFELTPKPTENAYMLLGQAYYQLEDYRNSLVPLKKAYLLVKERGDIPKEDLLLLLRVNYFGLNDHPNMIKVVKELITLYPKTEYWVTLGGAYSEIKQLKKNMSIFELLYESGELPRGNQQLNLANLYLLHEAPYKAALVLDKGMKHGVIKKEGRNLRLLSQAWLQAQESQKSVEPLKQAAAMSKNGELDIRLGQAYINLDRYDDAIKSLESGLKKGGLKRRDSAYIMLGMANFETRKFNAALKAFTNASKDARKQKRSTKSTDQWIIYVRNEQNREKQLEESLKRKRR